MHLRLCTQINKTYKESIRLIDINCGVRVSIRTDCYARRH